MTDVNALDDLQALVCRQVERALASGDLQPTATEPHWIDDDGVRFCVRVIAGRDRKPRRPAAPLRPDEPDAADPFLPPYDDELFVAEASPTHVVLLNKYPVVPDHLLVVTRAFEPQESALTDADFQALRACMERLGGLGFYNAGPLAGASQPHKHLQWIPLPAGLLPTEALLRSPEPGFPCASADVRDPARLGDLYRALLDELRLSPDEPYNLLLTRDAMFVVPRSRHAGEGFPLNAAGYAGSLLVRSARDLARLRAVGPRRVLASAARRS